MAHRASELGLAAAVRSETGPHEIQILTTNGQWIEGQPLAEVEFRYG